jgi:hypothetical protein
MEQWMFWTTAVIFTAIGYFMGMREPPSFNQSKRITQETIDTLIDMGYLKTRGLGEDTELVKWNEEI